MMNARGLKTTKFNGKPVNYQGVLLEGSPRLVFWGDFFEPFMFDAAQKSLEWVIETCRDRNLAASEYLSEATALLNLLVVTTYEEMARIDQLLRGQGYPDSVARMPVADKVEVMKKRISALVVGLTHRGPAAPPQQEILNLRPGIWGVTVDLKALWSRWFKRAI